MVEYMWYRHGLCEAHGGRSDPTVCHVNNVPNTAKTTVCVLHLVGKRHTKMATFYGTTDFVYQEQGNVWREKCYQKP